MFIKAIILAIALSLFIDCNGLTLLQDEATGLEQFFRTMLLQSEGGYVLYDKKPVCINGFYVIDRFFGESARHKESVDLREGAIVWKKVQPNHDNIIIHVYKREDSLAKDYIHVLFINKKLFIQTVNQIYPYFNMS